ncbi:class I adenylate-forming enzyme family protein [Algihabitans albus]|uniref:class I adenylate-forming enzyme family protein n=1 Tax=Algihabitans albus TaxID=2164067 RepID=UPI000E5CCC24|nr:class I adenylate-forming enzyme family protein [Algihabitans albus]
MTELRTMDDYLAHHAARTPDAEAAVEGAARCSYAALDEKATALARWLRSEGVTKGERVAVAAAPGLIYYTALMATSRLGAIYVGVNPRYTEAEIAHVLRLTDPVLALVDTRSDAGLAARVEAVAPALPCHGIASLSALPGADGGALPSEGSADDVAVIVFTSGSTGKPKGAALHHGGLIDAAIGQHRLSDLWPDGAQARYLSNLPVNHVGGIMNLTLAGLVSGGALMFQPKFDPAAVLEILAREKITTWLQVPAMFTLCVRQAEFAGLALPHLRSIGIGGGPVSAKTLAALRGLHADIFVEYGQTETMSTLTWSDKTDPDEVLLNTVGRFDPRFETRIADGSGQPVAPGAVGEVQARGSCTLRCYWNDAKATGEVFTQDGWLHTGDLAMQRPDGRVVLMGRAREMIKSGGYNVYPREVEKVLERHPAVAEVVVFGAPDEVYGERVEAAIELRQTNARPDPAELETHCRAVLAGYKLPRRFHLRDGLPRLPNGKIDRNAVRRAPR